MLSPPPCCCCCHSLFLGPACCSSLTHTGPQPVGTPAGLLSQCFAHPDPQLAVPCWTPSSSSPPSSILLCSAFARPPVLLSQSHLSLGSVSRHWTPSWSCTCWTLGHAEIPGLPVHHRSAGPPVSASLTGTPSWQLHATLPTFLLYLFIGMSSVVALAGCPALLTRPPAMLVLLSACWMSSLTLLGPQPRGVVSPPPQAQSHSTGTLRSSHSITHKSSHYRGVGVPMGFPRRAEFDLN